MQIRIGNKQDEPAVRELLMTTMHEASLVPYFDHARPPIMNMEQAYIGNDGTYIVAEDNKQIVGVAAAKKLTEDLCEICLLCVGPEWRRMGLGKQLLKQLIEFARQLDYEALQTDAIVVSTEAAGFLHRCGFKRVESDISEADASGKEVWRYSFR